MIGRIHLLHAFIILSSLTLCTSSNDLNCTQVDSSTVQCGDTLYSDAPAEIHLDKAGTSMFYVDIVICALLLIMAGLMSGLTLGLLSLDTMNLEIIIKSGEAKAKKHAQKILPLCKKHHLLLVTLLLANAACMETLPLFLDRLLPTYGTIILSVTLVLIFGEILPQAACSRYGLKIGASLSWLVWGLMGLLLPISWPISKFLDCILGKGHDGTFYRRGELKELLHMHLEAEGKNEGHGLTVDETTIMKGALDMKDKVASSIMTPMEQVFMLELMSPVDRELISKVSACGHSRIPIYRDTPDHIIGVLLVKNLIGVSPDETSYKHIDDLQLRQVPHVPGNTPLYDLLNQFQTGRSHIAVIMDPDDHITPLGIVTIEDVIEELIQEEILDEYDLSRTQGGQGANSIKNTSDTHSITSPLLSSVRNKIKIALNTTAVNTTHVAPHPAPAALVFAPALKRVLTPPVRHIKSVNSSNDINNNNNNNNNSRDSGL